MTSLNPVLTIGLLIMEPLFIHKGMNEGRDAHASCVVALACGVVAGPLTYLASPQWSVLLGGLVGGTLAWGVVKAKKRTSIR
jgi:ABC-type dipeptide/oligopeptide/nickel transport system ATPase component